MLTLLFAMFDIGLLFMYLCGLDYGVDAAVRWGAVNSTTVSTSTLLSSFNAASSGLLGSFGGNCVAYNSGDTVPAGTQCWIVVSFSNGAQVGSLLTVQANLAWSPVAPLGGFAATTLQRSEAMTIEN